MIDQSRIDGIKNGVDLKAYIEQATGSAFKKNGKGYICRCPFPDHEDKTPSFMVTPRDTGRYLCTVQINKYGRVKHLSFQ